MKRQGREIVRRLAVEYRINCMLLYVTCFLGFLSRAERDQELRRIKRRIKIIEGALAH